MRLQDFAQLFGRLDLDSLSLLGCRLGSLPHAVTHQPLQTLILRDCFLTYLPAGSYLLTLKTLDLVGNDFWSVPDEALKAPFLQELSMIGEFAASVKEKVVTPQ